MLAIKNLNKNNCEDFLRVLFDYYDSDFQTYRNLMLDFYSKRLDEGVKGTIAYEDKKAAGIVRYEPVEIALQPVKGRGVFFLDFILVLPIFRKKGYGHQLLSAVLSNIKRKKGLATWSSDEQEWMPGTFFDKYEFFEKDREGSVSLVYKKIKKDVPVTLMKPKLSAKKEKDKITIDFFQNYSLPVWLDAETYLKEIALKHKDKMVFNFHVCTERADVMKYGAASGIFINGENPFDLPPSIDEIKALMEEHIT